MSQNGDLPQFSGWKQTNIWKHLPDLIPFKLSHFFLVIVDPQKFQKLDGNFCWRFHLPQQNLKVPLKGAPPQYKKLCEQKLDPKKLRTLKKILGTSPPFFLKWFQTHR